MEFQCKAILFDLDGVLVDSRSVVERTWRRWAERHGLDAEPLLRIAHGRRTRDTVQAVAAHLDLHAEVAWLESAELEDVADLAVVPGAKRLLDALPQQSWAVVTSGGEALARRRLTAMGLPVPAVLVTSEAVTRGKPAPDGYRLAARRLGLGGASCVAFEDTPPGVAAARGAGAKVISLTTTHSADRLADADAVVRDFAEVFVRVNPAGLLVTIGAE